MSGDAVSTVNSFALLPFLLRGTHLVVLVQLRTMLADVARKCGPWFRRLEPGPNCSAI